MSWLARFRNVFRPDEVSDEIDREMAFHLAERIDELVAAGASPEAARREARRGKDGVITVEESRTMDTVLEVVRMLQQLRLEQRSFVDVSAWRDRSVTVPDPDGTLRQYEAGLVSGNAFEVLGARPGLGRLITPSDDVRGGPAHGWPVVVSDGFWRDRFGADPRVVGASLEVSGTRVTIEGVMPPSFHGVWPGVEPRLYLPMQFLTVLQGGRDDLNAPTPTSSVFCAAIARLRPGVSHAEANAEIGVYQQRLLREFAPPDFLQNPRFANARLVVESARTGLPTFFGRSYSAPLFLMQGLVAIVLLLCCVNVSGLMMAKLHERQHEFAVRTAIGAGRLRLVRQSLTESFVIALAGAALGAALAWYGTGLLLPFFRHPDMGTGLSMQPDHTVFVVTAALAVLTTLVFGMWPAWRAGASNPGTLLKSRTAAQGRVAGRGFVAIQMALSVVLVVSATLLSRSLARLRGEPTGFDLDHVTIQTPPFHLLPQKGGAKLDLYQRMVDRIGQAPGVRSAAVTCGVILRMVFTDALRLVAIGVGLGTVALFFAAGPIRHMLYGVSAFDVTTLAATAALLTLVVVTASFWPARRAASVDPVRAMRAD